MDEAAEVVLIHVVPLEVLQVADTVVLVVQIQ
jgi:hypothetical protein